MAPHAAAVRGPPTRSAVLPARSARHVAPLAAFVVSPPTAASRHNSCSWVLKVVCISFKQPRYSVCHRSSPSKKDRALSYALSHSSMYCRERPSRPQVGCSSGGAAVAVQAGAGSHLETLGISMTVRLIPVRNLTVFFLCICVTPATSSTFFMTQRDRPSPKS